VLVNQNNLRQHERSVHPVGVTCDQCGRVSGSEQSLHVVACRSINDVDVVRATCESPPGLDRVLP
jgi:ribosomal protein S26